MDSGIFKRINVTPYWNWHAHPSPSVYVAISNDGRYAVTGGSNTLFEVTFITDSCSTVYDISSLSSAKPSCGTNNLSNFVESHSNYLDTNVGGLKHFSNISISDNGDKIIYFDQEKWAELKVGNYKYHSDTKYLALGDSYSSAEGDMSLDNTNHYLKFTDIYGDYYHNIPRETCHVSDRSYPMLLAKQMNATQNSSMYSVACSGAVIGDVYDNLNLNLNRTSIPYLGQFTQVLGDDKPRLAGISNAAELQQNAIDSTIQGRIRQIEHVKKLKPEVLTIGMGGNDIGFGEFMAQCLTPKLSLDQTCYLATQHGRMDTAQAIYNKFEELVSLYEALHRVSPETKMYVTGYPQMFSIDIGYCPELPTLNQVERIPLYETIAYLNAVIKAASLKAGASYIDIADALISGQQCASSSYMTGIDDIVFSKIYTEYAKYNDYAIKNASFAAWSKVNIANQIFMQEYASVRGAQIVGKFAYSPYTEHYSR